MAWVKHKNVILCLNETWSRENDDNIVASFSTLHTHFFSCPIMDKRGNGVAVTKSLRCKKKKLSYENFECMELIVNTGYKNFIIYLIYRPPGNVIIDFIHEYSSFL